MQDWLCVEWNVYVWSIEYHPCYKFNQGVGRPHQGIPEEGIYPPTPIPLV